MSLYRNRILPSRPTRRPKLPLAGALLAVKDNICVAGWKTTAGSRALSDYVPPQDATVVSTLRAKGCVVVGKTLCDEFGMGSTTESSASHASEGDDPQQALTTRNPWDLGRVPGGSSGGSAAAKGQAATALRNLARDNVANEVAIVASEVAMSYRFTSRF